jgi:hypothetical protein
MRNISHTARNGVRSIAKVLKCIKVNKQTSNKFAEAGIFPNSIQEVLGSNLLWIHTTYIVCGFFRELPQFLQAYSRTVPSNKPRSLHFTLFLIHDSLAL